MNPLRSKLLIMLAAVMALDCGELIGIEERVEHLVTLRGQISSAVLSQADLTTVRVCLPDISPNLCATPNAFGYFELAHIPGRARHRVSYTTPDAVDSQQLLQFGDVDRQTTMLMLRQNELDGLLQDYVRDPSLSVVLFFVTSDLNDPNLPGLAGFEITLDPLQSAEGPLQIQADGSVVNSATTSETGGGFFINVPAGEYQLTVQGNVPCAADTPSAASEANRFDVIVNSGLASVVVAECKPSFDD